MSNKENPYFSNNPGCMSWHPYFSVTRKSSETNWVPCEKVNERGVRCINQDGMGHEYGNLKTPHIFPKD